MNGLGRFSGERLRAARVVRGMTASSLAERVGVAPSLMSHYERKSVTPPPDVVERLSRELRVPVHHFMQPPLNRDDDAPFRFRSLAAATKRNRESVIERTRWLREICRTFEQYVDLPTADLPLFDTPSDPNAITEAFIEESAVRTRRAWNMGDAPVKDLVALLEAHGCLVARFAFGTEDVEAVSQWEDSRPVILLNSDSATRVRSRFDAAHELGHLVLHRNVPAGASGVPAIHKLLERQAHRFARAFIFPTQPFRTEIYTTSIDALVAPKRRWGLSVYEIITRAAQLGMISDDQATRAYVQMGRKWGGRKDEPLDNEWEFERPVLMTKALELILGERTLDGLCAELPYEETDIEILTGLQVGDLWKRFGPEPAPVGTVLPFRRRE